MEDLVLTIEQCKHLQELGLDMSDAKSRWICYHEHWDWTPNSLMSYDDYEKDYIYTYTLQEALDRLPFEISDNKYRYELFIDYPHNTVFYYNFSTHKESHSEQSESHNILDSAYNMLCWVIEKRYLKVK